MKYEDDCYFGQVLKIEENRLYIKFISKSVGKKITVFEHPLFKDEVFVDKTSIVCKITTPVSNGKYLIVSDYYLQKARKVFYKNVEKKHLLRCVGASDNIRNILYKDIRGRVSG